MSWLAAGTWLGHCAAGGGLLVLVAWALMRRARQPARQQRLGEYGVLAALLVAVLSLAPAWLLVPVPVAGPAPAAAPAGSPAPRPEAAVALPAPAAPSSDALASSDEFGAGDPDDSPAVGDSPAAMAPGSDTDPPVPAESAPPTASVTPAPADPAGVARPAGPPFPLADALRALLAGLCISYMATALLLIAHRLVGWIALWRLLRAAEPAAAPVVRLAASFWRGHRPPRLLVSRRLRVPISCGVWRPTVVLPAGLADNSEKLPWVLAHELTHLERRDAWTCLLLSAGEVVYFYLPWFWWLRRRVGLCQELVADAAVAALGADLAEYAQFLLGLAQAPAAPAGATGVAGRPSDLLQRVTRLLREPQSVERSCPWWWSGAAAVGLALPAVVAAGVGLRAVAAPAPAAAPAGGPAPAPRPAQPGPDSAVPSRAAAPAQPPPPSRAPAAGGPGSARDGTAAPWRVPNASPQGGGERLGIWLSLPRAALRDQLDLPPGRGLVIEAVSPGSAAERGGLRPHDILLALDGAPVAADIPSFQARLAGLRPDAALAVTLLRRGHPQTLVLRAPSTLPGAGGDIRVRMPPGSGDSLVTTSVLRTGDSFAARYQDGALVIELLGTATERGVEVRAVVVRRGGAAWRYGGLDEVPSAYRAAVRQLLEVSAPGSSRVRIHSS